MPVVDAIESDQKEEAPVEEEKEEEPPSLESSVSFIPKDAPESEMESEEEEAPIEEEQEEAPVVDDDMESEEEEQEEEAPIEEEEEEAPIEEEEEAPIEEEEEAPIVDAIKRSKFQTKRKPIEELKDIDGMKLNNPYFFQDRIQKREPSLILIKKQGNYDRYSRVCPSSVKRQPVILTKDEKDKIQREYPDALKEEDVVKYGSDKKNPYYYICPRYWCLKTNSYISEEDVKNEVCGKVIPKGENTVKKGYYTYEFYKENEKRYPGFQVDKHPTGKCLPCCFKTWNTEEQLNHRRACSADQEGAEEKKEEPESNLKPNAKIEIDEYIKGPEKVPLRPGRLGYLPLQMQKLLHEVNMDCQVSKINSSIKQHHPCLLRHGVEISETQSFIACIADAIFFARKNENGEMYRIPTIKEMKNIIIKTLTIENFVKYQNGNLITTFYKENSKVDVSKYPNKLAIEKKKFRQIIAAFENFILFLQDDKVNINYSYLWDMVSSPNKNLFQSGINLIIFEIVNNDTTNNIDLICPTNHYSGKVYDARKPNLLLLQQGNYFEPIYSYKDTGKKREISKTFSEYDPQLSKTMMAVFTKIIKPRIKSMCAPMSIVSPKVYTMKSPLLLTTLIELLHKKKYEINSQIVNYDLKVIGVIAEKNNKHGFIPCYPSSINDTYDHSYMTEDNLWNNYPDTISFLKQVVGKNHLIPCEPAFNIIEDEHVIGILTETDQFIQLSEPYPLSDVTDDIPRLDNTGYLIDNPNQRKIDKLTADSVITTSNKVDAERVEYIKRIKLETQFYNVFRNTIRILLNDYENLKMREKIEAELAKKYMVYSHKMTIVHRFIKELVGAKVQFSGDANFYKLIDVDSVSVCVNSKCNSSSKMCELVENNECSLILPEKNLLTQKNNEEIYYTKFADELIRYNRIKSFIFQPQAYLSFDNVGYNLHENELLLLQSLITQEYFEGMIPAIKNKFTKYNSYDTVTPFNAPKYDNKIDLNDAINEKEDECAVVVRDKVRSIYWRKCFPASYGEVEYGKTNYCSLFFMIDLINKSSGVLLTENQMKTQLYEEYTKYLPTYRNKILDILTIQGKKTLCDQVKKETITFINFIYTDSYFFTTLDLWLLIERYKIPSFFISSKFLLETEYNKHSFNAYGGAQAQRFVFIVLPGLRNENVPSYKLICDEASDIFISMDKLVNEERLEELREPPMATVEDFLKKFSKNTTTNYTKKLPGMEAAPVKRRFRYIDDPIVIEDEAPRIPAKKVKLRVVDKPRVRDSESVISEIKALKVDDLDTGKKKTKKQKAKEIHVKGDKSRRKPRVAPVAAVAKDGTASGPGPKRKSKRRERSTRQNKKRTRHRHPRH